MKTNRVIAMFLVSLIVATTFVATGVKWNILADGTPPIVINETTFPDDRFREILSLNNIDADENGELSQEEIDNVTKLNVDEEGIESLKGIEYFTKLEWIDCSSNSIKELDLTANTKLKYINCSSNSIESLKVSGLSALSFLFCEYNELKELDVSGSIWLHSFFCDHNSLTSLNLTNCSNLMFLGFGENEISSIDLSKNKLLSTLECYSNQLSSLDVSELKELKYLLCYENKISSLDVSNNTALKNLECGNNQLTSLDVSNDVNLMSLNCDTNQLTSLDVSSNTALGILECGDNHLSSLNVLDNIVLRRLVCYSNEISSIDLTRNTNLRYIDISKNNLSKLDIAMNVNLTDLVVNDNALKFLDVTNNKKLKEIYCQKNSLQFLDITELTDLEIVDCQSNQIQYINISSCPELLCVYENQDFTTDYQYLVDSTCEVRTTETALSLFVNRLYDKVMGRPYDIGGKEYWMGKLREGLTGAQVTEFFYESKEFKEKDMSDGDYLDNLYRVFFDREADAPGKEFWLDSIAKGESRDKVLQGFINSKEWANVCLRFGIKSGSSEAPTIVIEPNQGVKDFVERLYTKCLARPAEDKGFSFWTNDLANMRVGGLQAGMDFFNSEEFVGFNLDNVEFVKRLYLTFMGRDAEVDDPNGFNYWVGVLESGQTRHDVIIGFADCPEFRDICVKYGIIY